MRFSLVLGQLPPLFHGCLAVGWVSGIRNLQQWLLSWNKN